MTSEQAKQAIQNAINQGAGQSIIDAVAAQAPPAPAIVPTPTPVVAQPAIPGLGDRNPIIERLIQTGQWTANDRQSLLNTAPDTFHRICINSGVSPTAPTPTPATNNGWSVPQVNLPQYAPQAQPTLNQDPLMAWLQTVPESIREMVTNGLQESAKKKTGLIQAILNCKSNRFTREYLATLKVDQLEGMAALAGAGQTTNAQDIERQLLNGAGLANYSGQASVPMFLVTDPSNPNQTQNAGDGDILALPQMNYADDSNAKTA